MVLTPDSESPLFLMTGILVMSLGLNVQLKLLFKRLGEEKCTGHRNTSPSFKIQYDCTRIDNICSDS